MFSLHYKLINSVFELTKPLKIGCEYICNILYTLMLFIYITDQAGHQAKYICKRICNIFVTHS
jgi:hypothetical protein